PEKKLEEIKKRALKKGSKKHYTIKGINSVFENWVKYLIMLNALKGSKYPLCVGAERAVQAEEVIKIALKEGANAVAHGSTKAGNDQIRFDSVFQALAPELDILTPIRDLGLSRKQEAEYLKEKGIKIEEKMEKYSINESIWGVTIGGGKIHSSWEEPPEDAWLWTEPINNTPNSPEYVTVEFEKGIPVGINDNKETPLVIMKKLNKIGSKHGFGRMIHVGDTILGIKGRIALEAPATFALIEAHRELEKTILTSYQLKIKQQLTENWITLLHNGLYLDPVMNDIHAFLDNNQQNVSGRVKLKFYKGTCNCVGTKSPFSLMDLDIVYGETSSLWDGKEARGFAKLHSLQTRIAHAKKRKEGK
ncbi:MAG: argininosuccinate synthase, partial [Candidatus Ranarchaeia archaeon]